MFDAYEVAVKLKLIDQFSGSMRMMTRGIIAANTHATKLQERLEKIGSLFRAGVLTTGAGFGMAMALKASTNEAVRYEQQLNRLKALNLDNRFGAGTTKGLEQLAKSITDKTLGTTQREALRLVTETQSITGDVRHTYELAPVLAKMRFGMEAYMSANGKGDGHGGQAEKQFQDIVKLMEMRGLMRDFTQSKLDRMADLFVKNYVASGGMVKPSDFLMMMKTGGVAAKSTSDDFMFALGHIMQEKGGFRSGTAMMSLYQNMVAGRMPQQVAETLNKFHLLNSGAIHYGKTGHITKVDPGGIVDYQMLIERPDLYLAKHILPNLAAGGVNLTDTNAVLMKLNSLTGQRTAGDFWAQMFLERGQIANYVAQAKNAMGYQQLYDQSGKSTAGQQADLQAKVNKLELEFGTAALPLLKNALEQAIPLVKKLGEWLGAHPEGLSTLVKTIAALSVAMIVSGPLMIVGSGLKLLSTGLTLMAGPLSNIAMAMAFKEIGGAAGLASLAGGLRTVAGQFKLLGQVGLLAVAGYGSYELATALGAGWLGEWIGGKVYDWTHSDPLAKTVAPRKSQQQPQANHTHVYVDGKELTNILTGGKNTNSTSLLNPLASRPMPATPGMGY